MSRLTNLLAQVKNKDSQLGKDLEREFKALASRRSFGLNFERHRRISPLFHAENIVRPLLVVQGANDPRVLQVESDELVAAV